MAAEAVRSSPRKLQFCSQITLAPPKKGRVCRLSRNWARALRASPLLLTEASIVSWSAPPSRLVPLLEHRAGALLDGKLVLAADQEDGEGGMTEGGMKVAGLIRIPRLRRRLSLIWSRYIAHVFDLLKKGGGDIDSAFLRGGQGQAIAGAGVNFHDFAAQFVFLLEDEPRVVGGILEFRDDDPLDGDAEALENMVDEIVGQGPLIGDVWRRDILMAAPICGSTWMTKTFF